MIQDIPETQITSLPAKIILAWNLLNVTKNSMENREIEYCINSQDMVLMHEWRIAVFNDNTYFFYCIHCREIKYE